jgi:hypothetical protein
MILKLLSLFAILLFAIAPSASNDAFSPSEPSQETAPTEENQPEVQESIVL